MSEDAKLIQPEEVKHVAKLSKLELSSEEVAKLSTTLSATLNYIDVLDELDTSNVLETFQVTGLTNVFQIEGEAKSTLSQEDALSSASDLQNNLFGTRGVFDEA